MKVAGIGDNVIDRYMNMGIMYPGGNAVNVAAHASRLGARAAYVGSIGADREGRIIRDALTALHVDLSQCIFHEDSTTKKCDVNVYDGERDYIGADEGKNWAHTTRIRDCDVDYLRDFDVVHTSCNAKLHEDVHKLQDLPAMVTFDFSVKDKYRTHEFLELTCPYLELGQFSCEHMETDAIRELMQKVYGHGCRNVVATMGAGDSFIAAVIVSLLNQGWKKGTTLTGDAVRRALQDGASYSAENCLRGGGFGFRNLIEE